MNEPKGNNHQDDPDRDIEQPPAPVEHQHAAVNDAAGDNRSNNKETNWPQRIEAICAVLLVVITGFYTFYARKQLKAMQGQIAEMKNARGQSKLDNANAITAQQAIAQSALSTSQRNFDKTSQSAENTFRDEQRAWVGALATTDVVIKEGEPPSFRVVVTNSGKTPALHLHFNVEAMSWLTGKRIKFTYLPVTKTAIVSNFVLQPGAQYFLQSGAPAPPLIKPQVDAITSGANTLWIYGKLTYEDVAKRLHHTKFCFIMTADLKSGQPCDTYNDAD
jgi:hypothetical protein